MTPDMGSMNPMGGGAEDRIRKLMEEQALAQAESERAQAVATSMDAATRRQGAQTNQYQADTQRQGQAMDHRFRNRQLGADDQFRNTQLWADDRYRMQGQAMDDQFRNKQLLSDDSYRRQGQAMDFEFQNTQLRADDRYRVAGLEQANFGQWKRLADEEAAKSSRTSAERNRMLTEYRDLRPDLAHPSQYVRKEAQRRMRLLEDRLFDLGVDAASLRKRL